MASTAAPDVIEGPVLSLINKRLRALRKKLNRIVQMEESLSQGKALNKEQEDVVRSKPHVTASIDELEKIRQPLASAVSEEISLAVKNRDDAVEDVLKLLYFGSMFDVKSQNDFTSVMLTRTHERGCCLTYDYVTDDEAATDLLGERDLDLISQLGGLLISRPVDSSLSHKHALERCIEHAKQWLANSDQPVDSDANVTYAELRAKLNKIMASDYFTITPEMKATVEMAAAAAGNYGSFQVPVHGPVVPVDVPVQVEVSEQHQDEDAAIAQGDETYEKQSSPTEEPQKGEFELENPPEVPPSEFDEPQGEAQDHREVEIKEQHFVPRRNYYQNKRGGHGGGGSGGGGRRGYPYGRGGRGSSRGGRAYQNGVHNQYLEQPGNYYQRNYHYNRERGGRSGGNHYNGNYVPKAQSGSTPPVDS